MFVPWRKQTNKPLRMSAQYGTIASQLDETNFLRWFLKYVNWGIFQDTKQTTVYGLQEQQSCTRQKFRKKKIIQERTGHRSLECLRMYERTSDKQQRAVSNILSSHSQSSYHAEMARLDHNHPQNAAPSSTSSVSGIVPNMKFDNCQVNINVNHAPSAPVNFTSNSSLAAVTNESHQITSEPGMPSAEDILQFLKDLD